MFHNIICLKQMSPRFQTRHRSSYKTTNNVLQIKVHYTRAVPMVTANDTVNSNVNSHLAAVKEFYNV